MSSSYGVKIHGRKVSVNGEEIPNVASVHYSNCADSVPRTVIEVDGDFDFEGLSNVEFVFHPSSIRDAVEALSFFVRMDRDFCKKFHGSIVSTLNEFDGEKLTSGDLANRIMTRLLEDLD